MRIEITCHAFGITQAGQRALNQDAVIAAKHAGDLLAPALGQQL